MRTGTPAKLVTALGLSCVALYAAPPRDALGVTVDFGTATLIHRPPVMYPEAARKNHIEGTVTAQATADAAGNVIDARTISGPDELRKGVLLSVLQWHFGPGPAGSVHQVSVTFQVVEAPSPGASAPVLIQPSAADAEYRELQNQMNALTQQARPASQSREDLTSLLSQLRDISARIQALQRIGSINLYGVYEDAARDLMSDLPLHPGDSPSSEKMVELSKAVRKFDEHLSVSQTASALAPSELEIRIVAPGSEISPQAKVGANVQNAQIVTRVAPVYPPEAKAARIQGAVKLSALIGSDGAIKALTTLSGHPLLVQAAIDAVKQWVYKPTLLNGAAVEVSTDIDVNFTVSQ